MSKTNLFRIGNDTIDRYPLPYGGKLTKLLCITKEVFEKLKAALDEFALRPKLASPKPKTPFQQKFSQKECLRGSRSDDLKPNNDKHIGFFEPSNIFTVKSSSFWRLQNLKTWFKEQESYEDLRYLKAYKIEI